MTTAADPVTLVVMRSVRSPLRREAGGLLSALTDETARFHITTGIGT